MYNTLPLCITTASFSLTASSRPVHPQVFNYSDPFERAVAAKYRDAEVPFKVYGVPDVEAVTQKWTDEYLLKHMDDPKIGYKVKKKRRRAQRVDARILCVCVVWVA
jgi:hypothetical protein